MGKFDKDRGRNRNEVRESASAANKTPLGRPTSGFGAKSPGSGGGKTGGSLLKPAYLVGALQDKQGSSPSSSSSSSSFSPQKPSASFSSFANSYGGSYGSGNNNSKNANNTPSQSQSRFGNQDYSSSSAASASSSYSNEYYNNSGSGSSYGNYNQNRYNQNRTSSYSSTPSSGDNNNSSSSVGGGGKSNYQNYQNYGNNNSNNSGSSAGNVSGRYSNDNYALATNPQFSSTSSQFSSSSPSSFMSISGSGSNNNNNSGSVKRDYNISMGSGNNGNNYSSSTAAAATSSAYGGFDRANTNTSIVGLNYVHDSGSSSINRSSATTTNIDDNEDGTSERKRRRKSRWMGEVDEKAVIPGMPTILPSGLPEDQQEIYISQLQVEEITRKLRSGDLGIPPTLENRSPSPEPMYGADGKRLNTREYRTRKKLEEERHKLITRLRELNPEYKPPSDYRQPVVKIVDRISIPQDEYPDINFVGLLIGPRGNTLKGLEKDTGAKIIIRGKGSVKEGKVGGKGGQPLPGEDEPLHAYVTSNNPESVKKACEKIREILRQGIDMPESENYLRKNQLRELALLNGTLREGEGPKCSNCGVTSHRTWNCPDKPNVTSSVVCTVCGGAGHIGKDCIMKRPGSSCPPTGAAFNYQEKAKIDEEYMSLMAELGEGKSKDGNSSSEAPQRILRNRPMAAGPSIFDKPIVPMAITAGPLTSATSSSQQQPQQQQSYQSKNYGNQSQRQPSSASSSSSQQQHYQQRQNKNPQQQRNPPPPPPSGSAPSPVSFNMPPPNFAPSPTSASPQGNPYYSGTYPPSFQGAWSGSYSSSVPPPPGWGGTPWGAAIPPPPPTTSTTSCPVQPPLPPS